MSQLSDEQVSRLLIEAGSVISSSLDPAMTMMQVAELTLGALADMCVIDLLAPDGSIFGSAVAATDPQLAGELEGLRNKSPIDPAGPHPVARVLRNGSLLRIPELTDAHVELLAQSPEHERFVRAHDYRSAIVAPLQVPGRTLGALSVLRLGSGAPYEEDEELLVQEIARRAANAMDNGRLYVEIRRAERRFHAILENLAEAVIMMNDQGRVVYANRVAAELLGFETPDQVLSAPQGSIWARFAVFDEQGAEISADLMPSRRLLRGEKPEPLIVRNVVRETGEVRWLRVRGAIFTDEEQGGARFVVNVYENISDFYRE